MKYFFEERTKNNRQFVLDVRNIHRIIGTALFILGKINIYIGLYSFGLNTLLIVAVVWSFTLLFIMSGFEVLNSFIQKGLKLKANQVIAT